MAHHPCVWGATVVLDGTEGVAVLPRGDEGGRLQQWDPDPMLGVHKLRIYVV